MGTTAIWGKDTICVDGRAIPGPAPRHYLMLNKPFGYICSLNDPEGRPVVTDLIRDEPQRCYPVGRLDFDTLGLLILTNDGEFAHHLTHPRFHVPKTYKVTVAGLIDNAALKPIRRGVVLDDGPVRGAQAELVSRGEQKSILRLTITEGRSRQVRRMLDAVGFKVIHLIRTGIGNLQLGDLKVGHYRQLTTPEIQELKKIAGVP